MDINDLRSLLTVLVFIVFIGIVWWAYSARRVAAFEEAARLPLDDEDARIGSSSPSVGAGRQLEH